MKIRSILTLFVLVILLIPISIADGPPSAPVRFDGSVIVNGESVEDGTVISIKSENIDVSTETTNSMYSVHLSSNSEEEYVFYVSGAEAGRHRVPAAGSYIKFDLEIVEASVEEDTPPPSNNGGSGSGGSGSSSPLNVLTEEYQSFQISINRGKTFQFDDNKHVISVDGVSGNTIKLNLDSKEVIFSLSEGETKEIDLDSDSDYLLNINADSVSGSTANILLKKVVRPAPDVEQSLKESGEIIETASLNENDGSFSSITGAFAGGLPDLSILQNIYLIIAVFIIVVGLLLVLNKRARQYLKKALHKVLSGGNGKTKK
jgi:hypothetical protein